MKKYYAVNGHDVRVIELRETPKYLISTNDHYGKFKKVENSQSGLVASNRKFSGYYRTGYEIYNLSSDYPKEIIKRNKERHFIFDVHRALEKRIKEIKTFEEALSINDLLGLDIKYPHSN